MKFEKGTEILWQDRKRHFGLPISFYRYYPVRKEGEWVKLFRHKGFFQAIIHDTNVYRCDDISMHQTLWDKIFGTGTIKIMTNDTDTPEFHLRHISHPYEVRDKLASVIEVERRKRRVGITEIQH